MATYRVRSATLDDIDTLVHHRVGMFTDMGTVFDVAEVEGAFRRWIAEMIPAAVYHAWVVEDGADVVGGGGITVLPWPPGPQYPGDRLAFVYNVYTEPAHRQRGVAHLVMDAIHAWCRENGISSVALNASGFGRSLYETMGYQVAPAPMMFLELE